MKLMAIDGNSIVNRAFYGVRALTADDGTPTNAVYGFIAILQKLIKDEKPDALCVAFDLPAPTFRHKIYDDYKAHRKPMPDELAVQMPILKLVLDAMNIPKYELAGWEADDLLGTMAKFCSAKKCECVIVTGDKDALQLVSDLTTVKHIKTRGGKTETNDYTPAAFKEEYGFEPMQMIDLKALMGDSSDNIPGVAGVGEKTAMALIQEHGTVGKIYENLDDLDIKEAVRNKLRNGQESAKLSYELATICTEVPFEFIPKDNLHRAPDNDRLFDIFKNLKFNRFITEFKLKPSANKSIALNGEKIAKPKIIEVTTPKQIDELLAVVKSAKKIALQVDVNYFDSIAIAIPDSEKVYQVRCTKSEEFISLAGKILKCDKELIGHDVKDIIRSCAQKGINFGRWTFDTALAAYLISPTDSSYSIAQISEYYCGYAPDVGENDGQMSMLADTSNSIAHEAYSINLLYTALDKKLNEMNLSSLYYDVELPLCNVLAKMETAGFLVDKKALKVFSGDLSTRIKDIEEQIYAHAGDTFNIASPKQLGEILFERLMLPAPKKTKTGYSTNIEVLNELTGKHPIIEYIKDYRELTKLKSTYADGLLKVIGKDGRIHTHFQMTVTATGRLSSTEPNLQNIPIRKEIGGEIRKMFIADKGNILVAADYSQIELRVLAHIANDPVMLSAFKDGEDIHAVTASQVFDVPLSEVTPLQRSRAKAVNFGIVYGISAFSLAGDIGTSQKEAKEYIKNYLEKYAGVRAYMEDIVKSAKELEYVSTILGRRRYLPELKSSNFATRAFGERVALNMPIQGTAADIMKVAMVNVSKRLSAEGLSAQLILQVHDELIVECPTSEKDIVSLILCEEMENAETLSVPLVAEARAGKSWFDAK